MEPTSQFIPQKEETWVDKLFQELGSELDFGDMKSSENSIIKTKRHLLEWVNIGVGGIFKFLLLVLFVAGIDGSIRNLETSDFIKNIPLCSYYIMGVENYSNENCQTYSEISKSLTESKQALEKNLAINLAILIPKKTQVQNVLNMPEVRFIQQKTGGNRTSIVEAMNRLMELENSTTGFKGEDIDCSKIVIDEKWELSTICEFYWFGITGSGDQSVSSRTTALAFLTKIGDPTSNFELLEQPKTLEIEKFTSTDLGIRSTFSTRTTLNLRLRYVTSNLR